MNFSLGTKSFFSRGGCAIAVLLILVVYGFEAHARRQWMASPATQGDQGAYLTYAKQIYDGHYTFVGDRNRMPVFPFLLSLIYRPGMSEKEFLNSAQAFNVNLSIALLLFLWLIFRKFVPTFHALALLVITAFGVFIYRAVLVQAEVLFYFISFCGFLLLLRMLTAPRWWLALLSGATMGIAHLTKASVLPALVVWAAVFLVQIFSNDRARRGGDSGNAWRGLGMLLLVIGAFAAVIFPYIRTSKNVYGSYFYNMNSTFMMWCDSLPEGEAFLIAYGEAGKWRELPADKIPSATKYWREHSVSQIGHRLAHGLRGVATQNAMAIAYYKFMFVFAFIAVFRLMRHPRSALRLIGEKPFPAAFCLLFFLVYALLYAWYDPIIRDTRFILSTFLPFVFAASLFILALEKDRTIAIGSWRLPFTEFFAGLLISLALIDVIYNAVGAYRIIA